MRTRTIVSLLALLVAVPADAEPVLFELETGNLNSGSGVALGGNSVFGLYPAGATIPVDVAPIDPDHAALDLDLGAVGIPDAVESLGGTRFAFTILSALPLPLTLELATGEINPALADEPLSVQIDQFDPGGFVPVATTTALLDLSTATMAVPAGCSGPARTGAPIDPGTSEVTLRGLACVAQLGSSTNLILDLKLTGTLPVAAPEPRATPLGASALATLGALARARRAKAAAA